MANPDISARVWGGALYGTDAQYRDLRPGDRFRFPRSDVTMTVRADGWYTDDAGRRFRTGAYTAIIQVSE